MDITKLPKHIQEKVYKPPPEEIYYSESEMGEQPREVDVPVDLTEEDEELVSNS